MNQGHSAAWDGDWDQAAEYYRLALQSRQDDPGALNNLGLRYTSSATTTTWRTIARPPAKRPGSGKISQIYERQRIAAQCRPACRQPNCICRRDVEKSIAG